MCSLLFFRFLFLYKRKATARFFLETAAQSFPSELLNCLETSQPAQSGFRKRNPQGVLKGEKDRTQGCRSMIQVLVNLKAWRLVRFNLCQK